MFHSESDGTAFTLFINKHLLLQCQRSVHPAEPRPGQCLCGPPGGWYWVSPQPPSTAVQGPVVSISIHLSECNNTPADALCCTYSHSVCVCSVPAVEPGSVHCRMKVNTCVYQQHTLKTWLWGFKHVQGFPGSVWSLIQPFRVHWDTFSLLKWRWIIHDTSAQTCSCEGLNLFTCCLDLVRFCKHCLYLDVRLTQEQIQSEAIRLVCDSLL